MPPIIALAMLLAPLEVGEDPEGPCDAARAAYEALSLDKALAEAEVGLEHARPLECLAVKSLVLMVLGRLEEARVGWTELFERSPDFQVSDPSLSPGMRTTIENIRAEVRPLYAQVSARWLIHESLRADVLLDGGLRDATHIRYETTTSPNVENQVGEVMLAGRAATATIAVTATDVQVLRFRGQVLSEVGRVLHQFSSELLVPKRPLAKEAEKVIVEVDTGGVSWPVWVGIGAAAVAATVTIILLAQPSIPEAVGAGRVPVDP